MPGWDCCFAYLELVNSSLFQETPTLHAIKKFPAFDHDFKKSNISPSLYPSAIPLGLFRKCFCHRETQADAGGYQQWEAAGGITIYIDYVSWQKLSRRKCSCSEWLSMSHSPLVMYWQHVSPAKGCLEVPQALTAMIPSQHCQTSHYRCTTVPICDPSATTMSSWNCRLWDSNPFPFHLYTDLLGQHGAILPSANHDTFLHHILLLAATSAKIFSFNLF